jgi:phage terminase Nu1 subunit (DNA packaging protein)
MANLEHVAYLLGVSEVTVGKLVKGGIVIKKAPGDYNAAESCRRYIAQQRPAAAAPNLTVARTRLTESKAATVELEQRRLEGELIEVKGG